MSKKPTHLSLVSSNKRVVKLGPVPVTDGKDAPSRCAIFLWGPAGDGKTTFAATAPGEKLWLSVGDNEHASVSGRSDVRVADLSVLSLDDFFKHGQSDNPFGLDDLLADDETIETVVFDSATALAYRALQKAVKDGDGAGSGFRPTMAVPGISAYGGRNARVLEVLTGVLRVTAKHNVNVIITGHEADPIYAKDRGKQTDVIDYIGVQLGGQLVNNMSWRLSEIWHMRQSNLGEKHRMLSIRPNAHRKPMKSRMFRYDGDPSFPLLYDANKPDKGQMTIASWHEAWLAGKKQKLPVPGKRVSHK